MVDLAKINESCSEEEVVQEGVPDPLEEVKPEQETEPVLGDELGTDLESSVKALAPLTSKTPVSVQFVDRGQEVIKDIVQKRKRGKNK